MAGNAGGLWDRPHRGSVESVGGEDLLHLYGPVGPGGGGAVLPPPCGGPAIRLLQGPDAQPHKLAGGVGGVDHIGEVLHMVGEEHGHDGLAGGKILIDPAGNHIGAVVGPAQQMEAHVEPGQVVRDVYRQLAAQQAAAGHATQSNPGGYIWPVDSRYITSTVGGRSSPGGIGSTNHKGTDIGRVGYTSSIYAAKSGTVIVSQYSSSYGNYVVISHGSGNTTLYAHMSSRKVEVGQYVNQGDVIGITGSPGNSTGPHLHFEVTENGVRVNPLSHGAEPRMGYLSGYTLSGSA